MDPRTATKWPDLSRQIREVVVVFGCLSVGCVALLSGTGRWQSGVSSPWAAWILPLALVVTTAAGGAPIGSDPVNAGTFAAVDSPVLMATSLLLAPLPAVLVVGVAALISNGRPFTAMRLSANTAKSVLATAAAAVTWHLVNGARLLSAGSHLNRQAALALLVVCVFNAAYLAVTVTWVRLTTGAEWRRIKLLRAAEISEDFAQTSLGAVAALVVLRQPVMLALLFPLVWLVHRATLFHSVEREAELDAKTTLYNMSTWRREAGQAMAYAARHSRHVSIAMFDLDHFRDINTAHGHLDGDAVLRALAQRMRTAVRPYDVVGRFGGEEFAVLMPDATADDARHVGERIRACIAASPVTTASGKEIWVTVSGGIVSTAASDATLDELLHRADAALYAAKNAGRDRVNVSADAHQ